MPLPLVLTLGDPAGIGPQIAGAAWRSIGASVQCVVIGCATCVRSACPDVPVATVASPADWQPDALCVIDRPLGARATPGHPDPVHAAAVIDWIETAVHLVRSGQASGLVTNPIAKSVLIDGAGFPHPGHTEFLAALDGAPRAVMMLASPALRVVPATVHIPLKDVPARLTPTVLAETVRITHAALIRDFGLPAPRIAVAGLNPHAGEDGKIGTEDQTIIAPTIERLCAEGLDITGPRSADTLFHARARAGYDAVVAMYHDQALIPIKTIDFDRGVNVTLGLSFVRTSPDHGTAFDIAGSGQADPTSLIEAIGLAARMAAARAAT